MTTWRRDYAGDPSVMGSTFWVNTKAVTMVGIAPQGFYGDRMSNTPPDYYLPIEAMPVVADAPYVHQPDIELAVYRWARQARRGAGSAAGTR